MDEKGREQLAEVDITRAFEQAGLSTREAEAARSALAGLTAEEAAREMGVSPSSVGNYRSRAYRKLGIKNSRELIDRFGEAWQDDGVAGDAQTRARLLALGLNPPQTDIAACILAGMTARQIAEQLCVAEGTVNSNRSRIYATLGIHSKDELAKLVAQDEPAKAASLAPRRTILAAALVLTCAALLFGAWHLTHTRTINGVGFSVNLAGQSYGNYSDAHIPEGVTGKSVLDYCPDLIEVTAANGEKGYASARDVIFGGGNPTPVYDASGLRVIGST